MRSIIKDSRGVIRFKANAIVNWIVSSGRLNLNDILLDEYSIEDIEEFWQLMGYSVSEYGELSFIREETVAVADAIAERFFQ